MAESDLTEERMRHWRSTGVAEANLVRGTPVHLERVADRRKLRREHVLSPESLPLPKYRLMPEQSALETS